LSARAKDHHRRHCAFQRRGSCLKLNELAINASL
jgi:hypothetical protein